MATQNLCVRLDCDHRQMLNNFLLGQATREKWTFEVAAPSLNEPALDSHGPEMATAAVYIVLLG